MADLFGSRQPVRLNDGTADANNAAILNTAPSSSDYGLIVRQVGVAAAAALADNTANPTTTGAAEYPHLFDGTTWDRQRSTDASDGNAALTTTGIAAAGVGPGFARRFNPANLGTAGNSASAVDINGASAIGVQVNTSTTGTYTAEVTNDGTTWKAATGFNYATGAWVSGTNLTPTAGDAFTFDTGGMRQFRLRTVSTLGATMAHVFTLDLSEAAVMLPQFTGLAALADATANPTVGMAGANLMGFNGTTWDRVRTANTGRLQVDVVTGGGSNASVLVDNAGFTDGTSSVTAIGGYFDEVAGTALTENDIAAARIDSKRAWVMVGEDATTRGQRWAISAAGALASNLTQIGGTTVVTGGTAGSLGIGGTVAHDGVGTSVNPALVGFYASAAAPSDVSNDGDATRAWSLRNGSLVVNLASGGTLVTLGQKVAASSLPVVLASDQFPAGAALADNTANPTTTLIEALGGLFDGTTWDRARSTDASDGNAALTTTGVAASGVGPGFARRFNPSNLGTATNSASTVDVNGAATAVVQVNTTTSGTYIFEVTDDGTTWKSAVGLNVATGAWITGSSLTPTVGDLFALTVTGMRQFRLRTVSTLGATMAHVITLSLGDVIQWLPQVSAAAALADATANPTIGALAANLMGYNGTTWDRVRTANTGRLQVDVISGGGSPAPSEVPSSYNMIDVYGSTSATAAGGNADVATNVPANTKLTYIRQISASASGATKVQLLFGATIKWVGFLTASQLTGIWRFDPPIPVTGDGSTAVKVNVTNREGSAMDLYARINAIVQA